MRAGCMHLRRRPQQLEDFAMPTIIISVTSILVMLLFWVILPDTFRVNEQTDYTAFYEPVARNVAKGDGFTQVNGAPATTYPPGYPLMLAGIFWLANVLNISEQTLLSTFILLSTSLTSVFIFILGRSVWQSWPALLPPLFWMTHPLVLWLTKQENSETPFMMIFYGTFCLLWWAVLQQWHAWPIYFLIGLLIGASMLTRPIALGVGFVMVAILWLTSYRTKMGSRWLPVTMILLGNLVAISPWEAW